MGTDEVKGEQDRRRRRRKGQGTMRRIRVPVSLGKLKKNVAKEEPTILPQNDQACHYQCTS